jgi:AcrR family transcriptional regulator
MVGKAGLAIRPQDRMSRRSNPEQKRSRARQRALLDAAEEILGEVGADGFKMREVARRANLPIASVYHYFPSAPALIRTLVERMLDELRAILAQGVVRAEGANPGEAEHALVTIIDAAGDFMESRPTLPPYGARCAARRNCAPSISPTQRAMRKSSPPPSALSCRARRRRMRRRSHSSSSRGFGVRFNSGASFRRKSARG